MNYIHSGQTMRPPGGYRNFAQVMWFCVILKICGGRLMYTSAMNLSMLLYLFFIKGIWQRALTLDGWPSLHYKQPRSRPWYAHEIFILSRFAPTRLISFCEFNGMQIDLFVRIVESCEANSHFFSLAGGILQICLDLVQFKRYRCQWER